MKASEQHKITWQNLNELKGSNGLYAKYGVRGIPKCTYLARRPYLGEMERLWHRKSERENGTLAEKEGMMTPVILNAVKNLLFI